MSNFSQSLITKQGSNLLARCQTGQTGIRFTKVAVGSGKYTTEDNLIESTALKDVKQELSYSVIEVVNDVTVYLGFIVTNLPNNTPLERGYHITEVGLYAEDDEHNEVLYAIATTEDGQCDYLPAYNGIAPSTITMRFYITATSANPISIVVDSEAHATAEDLNTTNMLVQQAQLDARVAKGFAQTHNTDPDAHQDIRQEMDNLATKEQLNNAINNTITGITAEINLKDEANTIAHNELQQALNDKANYEYIDSVRNELISNIDSRDEANSVTYDNLRQELDTKASTEYVNAKVADLVDSAPETLNTLKELSEALGNNPNFATTVATEIGNKANVDHTHEDLEDDITGLNNVINEKASKEYVDNATSELNTAIGVTNQQLEELQESVDNKSDAGHGHSVSDINDFPTSLPPAEHQHNWNDIKNKPTSFTAESHQHNASDITGLPTNLPANGGNADTLDNKHASDFALVDHDHNFSNNTSLLINGDFQIWQRGTEFTVTEKTYTADHWVAIPEGGSTVTVTKASDDIFKIQTSTGICFLDQFIEVSTAKYKNYNITISAKINGVVSTMTCKLGSYTLMDLCDDHGMVLTWHGAGYGADGLDLTYLQFQIEANTTLNIEWVKVEFGTKATPFTPRPYAQELADCQRYFQIVGVGRFSQIFTMIKEHQCAKAYTQSVSLSIPMFTTPSINVQYRRDNGTDYISSIPSPSYGVGGVCVSVIKLHKVLSYVNITPEGVYLTIGILLKESSTYDDEFVEGGVAYVVLGGEGQENNCRGLKHIELEAELY